jgi:hypothetical protein
MVGGESFYMYVLLAAATAAKGFLGVILLFCLYCRDGTVSVASFGEQEWGW